MVASALVPIAAALAVIVLANPKAAIFFTTLFASLLPSRFEIGFALAVLAVVAVVAAIVCTRYVLLALVFSRPAVQRGDRRVGRTVNRVAAGAIGVLGVRLVLDA